MRFSVFAIALLALSASTNAMALSVDNNADASGNAAKFGDPDDKIPFPHMADDGQPSHSGAQPIGNTGASFSFSGSSSNNNDQGSFERAQQRMQQ